MRANKQNFKKEKEYIMKELKLTEEQFQNLKTICLKDNWENYKENGVHSSFAKTEYLEKINKIIGSYGVESLYPDKPNVYYCNAGDTYNYTIILRNDKLHFGCWGNLFE